MRYQLGLVSPTPNVTLFLILIIASYLVFALLGHSNTGMWAYNILILNPYLTVFKVQLWRIITYGFLHDPSSPMHVIFNALILYMVGTPLEERWGEKRFLFFILCAVGVGGLLVCLSYLFGISNASVMGFSAATVALVIAWGLTFSSQSIYIFGILPLSGRQLVFVTIGFEILYAVSSNSISSAAHFGGIITAFILTFGLYKPARMKQLWYQAKLKFRLRK
jgi:membrane associated rhomboid family serine protease